MKKIVLSAAAVLFVAATGAASAAQYTSGTLGPVDMSAGTVVVGSELYTLANPASVIGLVPGNQVNVAFEEQNGERIAIGISLVPPQGGDDDRGFGGYSSPAL